VLHRREVAGGALGVLPTGVTAPNLGGSSIDDSFIAVGASTAGNVWAVGRYYDGTEEQNMAIHCC